MTPTNFRSLCFCDFCAEYGGYLLGTKTDSKDRDVLAHGFTEQFLLGTHGAGHMVPVRAPIGTQCENQIEI